MKRKKPTGVENPNPAGENWYYTPEQLAKPEEKRVGYKIRGLIGTEAMDVDFFVDEQNRTKMTSRGGNACLRYGLLGWKNFKDKNGAEIEFDEDDRRANIEKLFPLDALDLALKVWDRTFLTEGARKN